MASTSTDTAGPGQPSGGFDLDFVEEVPANNNN